MRKKVIGGLTLSAMLFALSVNIEAQQPKKIAKIGYLAPSTPAAAAHLVEVFRQGLRELGYVEGRTSSWNFATARPFIASLARPGGNITGLSTLAPEISGKRLQLLKEIVPKLSRVAVFGTSTAPGNAQMLKEIELAAGSLGTKSQGY